MMRARAAAVVTVALLSTAAFGCIEQLPTVPPYRGTLQVRSLMAATGPTSDNGAEYYQGINDALRESNEKGGIRGYLVEEVFFDHAYDIPNARLQYDQWKADPSWQDILMFFSWGTPDSEAFAADSALEGKPFISGSYATTLATPNAADPAGHHARRHPEDLHDRGRPLQLLRRHRLLDPDPDRHAVHQGSGREEDRLRLLHGLLVLHPADPGRKDLRQRDRPDDRARLRPRS